MFDSTGSGKLSIIDDMAAADPSVAAAHPSVPDDPSAVVDDPLRTIRSALLPT